jgi:hypothetical protein
MELMKTPTPVLYDEMLRDYRGYAETLWHTADGRPDMGYWGSGKSDGGNEGIRALANTALVYATLYAQGDRTVPVDQRVAPALCYAAAVYTGGVMKATDGKQWGGSWQSAMWAGNLGLAAWMTRDALPPDTLEAVKRVVAAEADRFIGMAPPDYVPGDTKAEENGWDLAAPSSALLLMPDDPRAGKWREAAMRYAFNTLSVKSDQTSATIVDGRPLKEWVTTANLFPDYSLENHGFFHPVYGMVAAAELGQAAMTLKLGGLSAPDAFRHNVLPEWDTLKYIILPDGEWIYPQGLDWALHDYEHIHYLAMLATMYRLPEAALLEQRLAAYARRRQLLSEDGRLIGDMTDLGFAREAVAAERIAVSLWQHRLFGPSPAPKDAAWTKMTRGLAPVRAFHEAGFILHRTPRGVSSFSWKNRLMGVVMPGSEKHLDQPYVATPFIRNLVGEMDVAAEGGGKTKDTIDILEAHPRALEDAFTVGVRAETNDHRLTQRIAAASLPSGTMVYIDRVTANADVTVTQSRGVPVGIQNDAVSGNVVRLYSAGGMKTLRGGDAGDTAISGAWANVDNRLGLIAPGGKLVYRSAGPPNRPGAREDILYGALDTSLHHVRARGEVTRRAAILLPNASAAQTAKVAAGARVDRGDMGTSISFRDVDGKDRMVSLGDDGTIYIPGLTPEPE